MSQSWKRKFRNKPQFNFSGKRKKWSNPLTEGVKGFLFTCNAKEAECVREGYNILDEYYEALYTKHNQVDNGEDIAKQLEDEINEMKSKRKVFYQLGTNCRNLVFVQSPEEVDPLAISNQLISDIRTQKSAKTRHLLRFIPVLGTCKASVPSIETAVRELLKTRSDPFCDYMVMCKVRNNDDTCSTHLIEVIANIVKQEKPQWRVKLSDPKLTINADVVCKVCCLSILPDFFKNKKYNLIELAQSVIKESEIGSEVNICKESTNTDSGAIQSVGSVKSEIESVTTENTQRTDVDFEAQTTDTELKTGPEEAQEIKVEPTQ
ncbi:THUMP domain-containing protein 1-like isoform X1 [Leptotrombidium deliense]|uniref:THUMP domain-containing protein 1-like isoform X1 n=1 Tax=Leptotrombidium deliense TaxID=299467 RepID=A0A443SAE7_9ACAR|nr:THUMP domain-containing protein 1-like isoform X1 [Leptotrombidium deliense]